MISKYTLIVCAFKNYNLNSREKFEPRPGFVVRGSNIGPGLSFSLEFKLKNPVNSIISGCFSNILDLENILYCTSIHQYLTNFLLTSD